MGIYSPGEAAIKKPPFSGAFFVAKVQPDENQDFGSERIVVETRCNFLALNENDIFFRHKILTNNFVRLFYYYCVIGGANGK